MNRSLKVPRSVWTWWKCENFLPLLGIDPGHHVCSYCLYRLTGITYTLFNGIGFPLKADSFAAVKKIYGFMESKIHHLLREGCQ